MSHKLRYAGIAAVIALLAVELALGWSSLAGALHQLRTPHLGWLALAMLAEVASMSAYARMQRRILRSAGVRAPYADNVRLAYAAHSLNETLPGGPAFSAKLNYQQMRRFGASPAVASWSIALSGILSGAALAVVTVGSALAAGGATHWGDLAGLLVAAVLLTLGVRRVAQRPAIVETLTRAPLAWFNRLRHRPAHHGHDRIHGFLEQLRAARLSPGHGVAAATYAVLNWLLDAVCLWLCFRAIGEPPAGVTAVLLAFCAAMAAGTITIVPGGLGIIDSALVLGLIAGGAAAPAALATVVLYRVITLGFILGLGWLSWLRIRRRPQAPTTQPTDQDQADDVRDEHRQLVSAQP
ncbi:YbhN family protein [Actinoplanes sp. NPDC026619]|uniref:lysylphosphatidylglycerol synthase transmembrane domain-containing protein n=1 Tax=Actinoplanes sp. NPDC026619 TaxID=3155798 RepID=UPI0033F7D093